MTPWQIAIDALRAYVPPPKPHQNPAPFKARALHSFVGDVEHKQCSKCNTFKPLRDFSMCNKSWDKHAAQCRACKSEYRRWNF